MPAPKDCVAIYHFNEGTGRIVHDASPHALHGHLSGGQWTNDGRRGKGLKFSSGGDCVKVRHTAALNLSGPFSLEVWAKGNGAQVTWNEMTSGDPPTRDLFFQVVGDKVYFATNTDVPDPSMRRRADWYVLTGSMHTDGSGWTQRRRTYGPPFAIEPKLQVVGDHIYFHYFGVWTVEREAPPERRWDQIYTGRSHIDGSDWQSLPRLPYYKGSRGNRTEQGYMQVVGERIYYAYPQMDNDNCWQLWTAQSNLDGTEWQATQRTRTGGWVPELQVMGEHVYYIHSRYGKTHPQDELYLCRCRLDGSEWEILRTLRMDFKFPFGRLLVGSEKIFFSYVACAAAGEGRLWTGQMNLDGSEMELTQRTSKYHVGPARMQLIGNRLHYAYLHSDGQFTQQWTAESNLDGTQWTARQRTVAPHNYIANYKEFQIVGGKTYFSGCASRDVIYDRRVIFGSAGSNLLNKGDAYGIGLTEDNRTRAFLNCGSDYLFRAEKLDDNLSTTVEHEVDNQWHHYVMSFDGRDTKFYVDAELKGCVPSASVVKQNPFDLVIGDGFNGIIDQVGIYHRPFLPMDVQRRFDPAL